MSDKTKQEELAKQVLETQEGITPEQLKALIEAEAVVPNVQDNQAAAEPASASASLTPASSPASAEPAKGQSNYLDLLPEQFRDKDVPTSLSKITKSYSDMEADLRKTKDEVSQLNKLVQSFVTERPARQPVQPAQAEGVEIDDAAFFERPAESAKRIAAKETANQIIAYHIQQERQRYVESFKAQHPEFDNYRDDIMAVLRNRPDLDRDERNLPIVYELAKQNRAQRINAMRAELGVPSTQPQGTPAEAVDVEAIRKAAYLKARDDLVAELEARRRASGLQGAGAAVSQENRVQPRVKEKELSSEDQLIQDMLNSGPKRLTLVGPNE